MNIRLVPGWTRILAFGLPVLLALGAAAGAYLYSQSVAAAGPPPAAANPAALDVPQPAGLLVHVIGAVAHPGLYRMHRGDRVLDAIAAAGGLTADADPAKLPNLAKRLTDGEQIKVAALKGSSLTSITKVSLNIGTLEELEAVPNITPEFAQAIIDYRTNYGGFQNIKELVDMLGMSEADFLITRHYVSL
jgi:competence protein ComEA